MPVYLSIATTAPLTGFSSAASAESPVSMKNAPAPPPPRTTRAITMISSIFLDFFGASAASFSSLLIGTLPRSVVVGGGRAGGLFGRRDGRCRTCVRFRVLARGGRQQRRLLGGQRGQH